jgi:hypothetical protein
MYKAIVHEQKAVQISEIEAKKIAIAFIERHLDVDARDVVAENQTLIREFEVRTSHSWLENKPIRQATDLDIAAIKTLQALYSLDIK